MFFVSNEMPSTIILTTILCREKDLETCWWWRKYLLYHLMMTRSWNFFRHSLPFARKKSINLLYVYHKYRRKCNNFIFVVLSLSSFTLHVSAVAGHHQVYFHLRSCHTAHNLKFKTTSSLNVVAAFQLVSYIRISLSVMFKIPVNIHSSIWFKILKFNLNFKT
jgi:hypothetical protein